MPAANAFNMEKAKIWPCDKDLTVYQTTKFWTRPN